MKNARSIKPGIALTVLISALIGSIGPERASAQAFPETWTEAQVMTPEQLLQELSAPIKPTVVAVTFKQLYEHAHVPGALYFGPGQSPVTIANLKQWAERQPKDEEIVLYCGCCPWPDCPNIRSPFALLKDLGFTKLRVVKIETDFRRSWVEKKYPVETSR
jgi:hypothetical protein